MTSAASSRFDQLVVGARWRSPGRTLTEADLLQVCMTSGDWHPIHADEAYAAAAPLGRRIFQGTYVMHVAVGIATQFPSLGGDVIGGLGFSEWRFMQPVFVGDTLRVEVEIATKRLTSDGCRGLVERRISVRNQSGEVVQQGSAQMMVRVERAPQGELA